MKKYAACALWSVTEKLVFLNNQCSQHLQDHYLLYSQVHHLLAKYLLQCVWSSGGRSCSLCQSQWRDCILCAPSSALKDSSSVLCLSTNWWLNLPCILQSFPEGNSKLYFKIEISVQQNVYLPAVSWGFCFFYLVLRYSLVPFDMFFECSVLGVTLKWYVQSVCLLKDLWLALSTGRYFPLAKCR